MAKKPYSPKKLAEMAGGRNFLAKKLGIEGPAISQWKAVPPRHVLIVERLTGVSRHKIRPDIYGDEK